MPAVPLQRSDGFAKVAIVGIAVSMVSSVATIVAALIRRGELVRLRDGEFVSDARLQEVDDIVAAAAGFNLLGYVVGAACFIPWFHRAYKNLAALGRNRHKAGWAIGGWFVPFLNLVRPYQIAKELALGGDQTPKKNPTNLLPTWWALVIVSGLVGRFLFRAETETVEDFIRFDTVSAISDVVWIVAGICLIVLIRRIVASQAAFFTASPFQ